MQRTKQKIIETPDYILNFEEQTCYIKKTKELISSSIEILQELARSYWREKKQNQKYYCNTLSYNEMVSVDTELFYFLSDSINKIPLNIIIKKENENDLYQLLLSLPLKNRIIMWKYYYEGKKEDIISQEVHLSKAMVHYYKKQAIKKIKQKRKYKDFL